MSIRRALYSTHMIFGLVVTIFILLTTTRQMQAYNCEPTIIVQTVTADGGASKKGIACGPCPPTVYMASNSGTGIEIDKEIVFDREYTLLCYARSESTHFEHVDGSRWEVDEEGNVIVNTSYEYENTTYKVDPLPGLVGDWSYSCTEKDYIREECALGYGISHGVLTSSEVDAWEHGTICWTFTEYDGSYSLSTNLACQQNDITEESRGDRRGDLYSFNTNDTTQGTFTRRLHSGTWLDTVYSTDRLMAKVQEEAASDLPEFSTDNPIKSGTPRASAHISGDQTSAGASRCKWRAKIYGTAEGEYYTITYVKTDYTYSGGVTSSKSSLVSKTIQAPSATWFYPSAGGEVIEASMVFGSCSPSSPGEHTIEYTKFHIRPAGTPLPPGKGVVDDGPANSGCEGCAGANAAYRNGERGYYAGIELRIGMGEAVGGGSIGEIQLLAPAPTTNLASASSLVFTGSEDENGGVSIERDDFYDCLSEIITPQARATVEHVSQYSTKISIFRSLYQPISTWTVENPDLSTNYNRLKITEVPEGGNTNVWLYTYNTNTGVWSLSFPGNLSEQRVSQITDSNSNRTETVQFAVPGGQVVWEESRVFTNYAWGEALDMEVRGSGNSARMNRYTYYESDMEAGYTVSGNQPALKQVVRSDGTWEYYKDYDNEGRPLAVLSGIDTGPTTNTNLCRSTEYSYLPVDPADDGSIEPRTARKTVEKFKGTVVGLSYLVLEPGVRTDIRCLSPTAAYDNPTNQVTVTTYYTNGGFDGWTHSILNPDGTMTIYEYDREEDGSLTTTEYSGHPNAGAIDDGIKTVTVTGPVGEMISKTTTDIASQVTIGSETYGAYDEFDRPQLVTYLDGTSNQTHYACCGLDFTVDRDGVVTQYHYDAIKRQTGYTRDGVTTSNVLDAAGQVIKTIRIGTDTSQILTEQSRYDLAGVVTSETNALYGGTTFIETNDAVGGLIRITIYPDGGISTNQYYTDGSLKEVTGTAVFPMRYEHGIESDGGVDRLYTKEIKLDSNGYGTSEWTKSYVDLLGRTYKTVYSSASGSPSSQSFFNSFGQMWKQVDPDGVVTLYQYNGKGEQEYTAIDTNQNDTIDFLGNDRITRTVNDVYHNAAYGADVRRTRTYVWSTNSLSTATLISEIEVSTNGLQMWHTVYRDASTPVTTYSQTTHGQDGNRTNRVTAPDGSYTVNAYVNGKLSSVTRYASDTTQIGKTTYSYDNHGRQYGVTDVRNGTSIYNYNNADQVTSVTTPAPGDGLAQTTVTLYDKLGRQTGQILPDGGSTTNVYLPNGLLARTSGSRIYPVGYSYDYAGRIKTMTNWSAYPNTGARVTTWNYDPYRGFLSSKTYQGGNGPSYTYTPAGRLQTRTWARGVATGYGYNNAGDLLETYYSDSTPGVTNTYNRRGQIVEVEYGRKDYPYFSVTHSCALTYNDAGQLLTEYYQVPDLFWVTNAYDTLLRRTAVGLVNVRSTVGGTNLFILYTLNQFGYDNASRLHTITDGTNSAVYTYLANSPLVGEIQFRQNGNVRMTTTKQYDSLNRLRSISSVGSASSSKPISYAYSYNDANQRTHARLADGTYWFYNYDNLGQVRIGKKYWNDQKPVAGQQFEYRFDDIGNRIQTKTGGDESGGDLRLADYDNNYLNQLTNRDVPGAVDIMGVALPGGTVTVGGEVPYRKGEYFRKELSVDNSSSAIWTNVTVSATGENPVSGNVFVPEDTEQFTYDDDGNLTQDGRWAYTWDGENRLISMKSLASTPSNSWKSLKFEYDYKSRRSAKVVSNWTGSAWSRVTFDQFFYDEWNLLAVLEFNSTVKQTFIWGLDLSGTIQGDGGVGGLLAVIDNTNGANFVAYDGNGNVAGLVKSSDGAASANYEYGPFGEFIRQTGPMAKANAFRFSSKCQDGESDLLYYGYRYYNPSTGRWLSRDPVGENGGINLYCFIHNATVMSWDIWGLLKAGDKLNINLSGKKIGYAEVKTYSKFPFSGKPSDARRIGATLIMVPRIDDDYCGCSCYKWRQYVTKTLDGKYALAPERSGKYTFLPQRIKYYKDILDIDYSKRYENDWYGPPEFGPGQYEEASSCAYTFFDKPEEPFLGTDEDGNSIAKVTWSAKAELVKLKYCGDKTGGTPVLTVNWGYWYTKDENGLLNNNK